MHPQSTANYRVAFDVHAGIEPLTFPASSTVAEIAEKVTAAFAAAEVPIAVNVAVDLEGDAVTVSENGDVIEHGSITRVEEQPPAEPDLRQRIAAELHRIADDVVRLELPLGSHPCLNLGVLDSRAGLQRWADHLGSDIDEDGGTSNDIPHIEHQIRFTDKRWGPALTVRMQIQPDQQSEVELLRARVAELEAQTTGGTR